MATMPMNELRRSVPGAPAAHRTLWLAVLAAGLAVIFIYSGTAWVWFRPVLHKDLINKYAAEYHFDPLWVMAIVKVESGFSSGAESHRGAVGLMQLLPSTAHELAPEVGLSDVTDEDLKNPDTNLRVGVHYLANLKRLFPDDDIAVLSAWNAGPGITRQWRKGKPYLELEDIEYPETRKFVRHVDQTFGYLKIIQGWKHLFGIAHSHGN